MSYFCLGCGKYFEKIYLHFKAAGHGYYCDRDIGCVGCRAVPKCKYRLVVIPQVRKEAWGIHAKGRFAVIPDTFNGELINTRPVKKKT